jgi:cytochrome c553
MRSSVRSSVLRLALVCGTLTSGAAFGQNPPLHGDPVHGKAISYTCLGCHGIKGYRNAYPNYSVPKLEGQHPEYLVTALQEYRSGERSHTTMHSQASSLSDQDIADIAVFFAGTPLQPGTHAATAPAPPQAAAVCVACHGADGVAIVTMYPTLAGQHEDYLARSIEEYRTGARKNPVMAQMVAALKDADIDQISQFYSELTPSLHTLERPYTWLTAGN